MDRVGKARKTKQKLGNHKTTKLAKVEPGPQHYERREVRLPPCLSREEGERLRAEYWQSVETPATNTLHTFPPNTLTQVLEGKGWIVPRLLRSADIT